TTGQRALDWFSLHDYPQGGEYHYDGNPVFNTTCHDQQGLEGLRNRSTREFWDSGYTSESYIGAPVFLIPRMKQWVKANYPGTKVAVTEYNWGAECDANGGTAQADLLGIFG